MVAALADLEIAIVPGGEFQTTLGDEVDEGALCRRRGVVDGVDDLLILMRAGDGEHLGEAGAADVGFAAHAAGDDDAAVLFHPLPDRLQAFPLPPTPEAPAVDNQAQ